MAKEASKEAPKANGATAAGATGNAAPATPAKRTRLAFSKEKKLAFLITGLVAIFHSKAVAAVLTEEQKAKVSKAKAVADESGGDPFKEITGRITAIQGELKAIDYSKDAEKAVAQALELGKELDRQIKRKKQIEEMIGG